MLAETRQVKAQIRSLEASGHYRKTVTNFGRDGLIDDIEVAVQVVLAPCPCLLGSVLQAIIECSDAHRMAGKDAGRLSEGMG